MDMIFEINTFETPFGGLKSPDPPFINSLNLYISMCYVLASQLLYREVTNEENIYD